MAIGPQENDFATKHPTRPARGWTPYTPSANVISAPPRGVVTSDAGDVTMEDEDANAITVTTTAGVIIPFSPTKITASTATTTYLVY